MADISTIIVRVHLRPKLTLWDALILRVAGPDVRAAFVRALDAAAEKIREPHAPDAP